MPRLSARIAVTQNDLVSAARLLGAWDEIHERAGAALDPYDVDIHTQLHLDVSRAVEQADLLLQQGVQLGLERARARRRRAHRRRSTHNQSAICVDGPFPGTRCNRRARGRGRRDSGASVH